MADDDRPDARDPELAARLAVDPLDEVTRRRLVTTALAATEAGHEPRPRGPRGWRWLAAAAAVVVVAAGGLAIVTAEGGHDEQQASRLPVRERAGHADSATGVAPVDVGAFGDLDDPTNLAALRAALLTTTRPTGASAETPAVAPAVPTTRAACASDLPAGTVLARGTGTLDGRPATVVLTELADGSRSYDAVLDHPCGVRHLR
jgi:hypothetical protein